MTIAFRQAPTTYVALSEKAQKEAAATANNDTKRLLIPFEERERLAADALRLASQRATKLSPQQV